MRLLFAAILFSFFAVFAPTSHGDRPLLFGKQQRQDKFEYPDFKLPLARVQSTAPSIQTALKIFTSLYFLTALVNAFKVSVPSIDYKFSDQNNVLFFSSSPLVFCEVLQV